MRLSYAVPITLLILLAICAGIAMADTTSIAIGNSTGKPGSTVKVPVNLAAASNIGAIEIVLTYDPNVLTATSVEKGQLAKNSLFDSNFATLGVVVLGAADTAGISGDGIFANIVFNVIGKIGDTSSLTVQSAALNDVNTYLDIPITVTDGAFTVKEEGGLSWAIIGAIIAVVLLILVAVVLVLRRRKTTAIA